MFSLIVRADCNGGIGKDGKLLEKNKQDMAFFKQMTKDSIVVMGYNTWKEIEEKYPEGLPDRMNIVITHNHYDQLFTKTFANTHVDVWSDPEDLSKCLDLYKEKYPTFKLFVIGGAQLYNWFYTHGYIQTMCISRNPNALESDVFFRPEDEPIFKHYEKKIEPREDDLIVETYTFVNHEEFQFRKLIREIYDHGNVKGSRAANVKSLFGKRLEFSLANNTFPLLTSKRLSLKSIFAELDFFLSGKTDTNILRQQKINVWNANTSEAFLKSRGLPWKEGDMGPSYSFQFRHSGAAYHGCDEDYNGKGFDQVENVLNLLKNNPDDRRIIINLWAPSQLDQMALPPCCFCYQFYVVDGKLQTIMTSRSSDVFLAGGWNIATGALLTCILAHKTGLIPDKLIWNIGDVHIYENQLELVQEYLKKEPKIFPKLFIRGDGDQPVTFENLTLVNYNPHSNFKIPFNI